MQLHSSISRLCSAFLFLVTSGFSVLHGQQLQEPAARPTGKISIDVVVTPRNGAPVNGLTQRDFTVLDNDTPKAITSFRAVEAKQEPVEVVIVLDAVNVPTQYVGHLRSEIGKFLGANGGQLAHPTQLAILTDKGMQLQEGFSTDGNMLSKSLEQQEIAMRFIGRDTGVFGAEDRYNISINAMRQLATHEAGLPGRKVILWVSPGWPILSGPGIQLDTKQESGIFASVVSLSTQLREARVTLYNIDPIGAGESVERTNYYESFLKGVSKAGQTDIGDLSLQVLASQSGGLVLNSNDTAGEMQKSLADTNAYYRLTFDATPTEKPNTYHHIVVKTSDPGLNARTRDGYYAQL